MNDIAIQVEALGKRYRLGERHKTNSIREAIASLAAAPFKGRWRRRASSGDDILWALRDISFNVKRGEVIGIIGKNGAGKSTLLKVLSRITEPTEGGVTIQGRVGSLLEVGTGFHPELTGRENIYLNGAILGMKRSDINHRFDDIVAFSEIEKFLDTPVKRYSSGMYMRLAFAVAAHLDPEILIVDEVLAVGDAEFQKKCLGKMQEAGKSGRTVLFVSHNLHAVAGLCTDALLLSGGRLVAAGGSREIIAQYLGSGHQDCSAAEWPGDDAPGDETARLRSVRVFTEGKEGSPIISSSDPVQVEMEFDLMSASDAFNVGFALQTTDAVTILATFHSDMGPQQMPPARVGRNRFRCTIPAGILNGGRYQISPRMSLHRIKWIVQLDNAVSFEVSLDHGLSPNWRTAREGKRDGVISPVLDWWKLD